MEKLSNVHFAEVSDYPQQPLPDEGLETHPHYPGSGIVSYRHG
jgi:hypothetical protein